jgi:RNA polymerase sigma-70 factor (ECF subfamily)
MLNNREDAQEITSEVFVRAFERAKTFRGEGSFRGWLFQIARNLCIDHIRQPRLLLLEPEESEAYSDMGRSSLQIETRIVVQDAVQKLSPEHRIVLLLCDVEEWDAKEVAIILERSLPATKSLLYRARTALREILERERLEEK